MGIGTMRKRLVIQDPQRTTDAIGGGSTTWSNVKTVWGEVKPASGREVYHGQQLEMRVTHKIKIRYRSDVSLSPKMRILLGSRVFNIRLIINEDERGDYWKILAEEGVAT